MNPAPQLSLDTAAGRDNCEEGATMEGGPVMTAERPRSMSSSRTHGGRIPYPTPGTLFINEDAGPDEGLPADRCVRSV